MEGFQFFRKVYDPLEVNAYFALEKQHWIVFVIAERAYLGTQGFNRTSHDVLKIEVASLDLLFSKSLQFVQIGQQDIFSKVNVELGLR